MTSAEYSSLETKRLITTTSLSFFVCTEVMEPTGTSDEQCAPSSTSEVCSQVRAGGESGASSGAGPSAETSSENGPHAASDSTTASPQRYGVPLTALTPATSSTSNASPLEIRSVGYFSFPVPRSLRDKQQGRLFQLILVLVLPALAIVYNKSIKNNINGEVPAYEYEYEYEYKCIFVQSRKNT